MTPPRSDRRGGRVPRPSRCHPCARAHFRTREHGGPGSAARFRCVGRCDRPPSHNHAAYQDADIATQAAILAHGVAQSQCSLDGNKRTALIAMTTFLALNGWDVGLSDAKLADHILGFSHGVQPVEMADDLRLSLTPRP